MAFGGDNIPVYRICLSAWAVNRAVFLIADILSGMFSNE